MPLRIVITTTLNDNLFRAKLPPLLKSRDDLEVVVVTDRQGPTMERVRWVWPRGFYRLFGRLGGRLLLLAREIFHPRTRLVMAYNVVPHGLFAVALARLRRRPVFLHLIAGATDIRFAHNPRISGNRVIARSKNPQRIERMAVRAARRANKLFVPGPKAESYLVSEGFVPEKIARLHSTIDLERFQPGETTRDMDVIVAAQLLTRKRPIFTLEVFAEILKRRPGSRFCWLGDGPMRPEFDAALDRLGLRSSVIATTTDDVASYYQHARVFLLCSLSEGLSLSCMEAMACGVVPVTSDCGDMAEVVRPGHTGELRPVEASPAEYADAVIRFLTDDELRQSHSRAARQLIAEQHSFDTAVRAWQTILESVSPSAA
jgi:glycosyltransferase involved in cell wall biosynthesis